MRKESLKFKGDQSHVPIKHDLDLDNSRLPILLSCKALVEERQQLRDVELHVFKIEFFLIIFLHLE